MVGLLPNPDPGVLKGSDTIATSQTASSKLPPFSWVWCGSCRGRQTGGKVQTWQSILHLSASWAHLDTHQQMTGLLRRAVSWDWLTMLGHSISLRAPGCITSTDVVPCPKRRCSRTASGRCSIV